MFSDKDFSRLIKFQKSLDKCPRCGKGPMIVDTARGELFCGSCGFVVKEKIEEVGPEWRAFSKEEKDDRSRGGIPTSIAMHDMGLATVIGGVNKDASGKSLSASMKATVDRLRTWDSRSQVHEPVDRNLRQAFSELDRLSDKLSVSDAVVEKAAYIYRKASGAGPHQRQVDHRDNSCFTVRGVQGQPDSQDAEGPGSGHQRQEEGHCKVL